MRAVVAESGGGPEVLTVVERPDPEPGAGEVVLDVAAAGLNRADLLQRQGFYPPPPGASDVLGMECSGTVSAVGDGVEGWQVGDVGCALLSAGAYATKVSLPAGQLMPVPGGRRPGHRGRAPRGGVHRVVQRLHGGRAAARRGAAGARRRRWHRHLRHPARRRAGRPGVHHGGQRRRSATCAASSAPRSRSTTRTRTSSRWSGSTPTAPASTSSSTTWARPTSSATSTRSPTRDGSWSSACRAAPRPSSTSTSLLRKRGAIIATALRSRPAEDKAAICASVVEHVWPLVADGSVRPMVHATLPLDRVGEAHTLMESGEHSGKILLTN